MKVYDYIVVCKRPPYKLIDGISQLMLLLAMISFASGVRVPVKSAQSVVLFSAIAGITGWLMYCYIKQRKGQTPYYRIGLLLGAAGWAVQSGWQWMSLVYFIAAALEKQVKFPVEFAFDDNEIVVNSLPRKHYFWHELSNAVIKDGLLTIDLKSNRIIQKEIEDAGSAKIENEFNEYCRQRIHAEVQAQTA